MLWLGPRVGAASSRLPSAAAFFTVTPYLWPRLMFCLMGCGWPGTEISMFIFRSKLCTTRSPVSHFSFNSTGPFGVKAGGSLRENPVVIFAGLLLRGDAALPSDARRNLDVSRGGTGGTDLASVSGIVTYYFHSAVGRPPNVEPQPVVPGK